MICIKEKTVFIKKITARALIALMLVISLAMPAAAFASEGDTVKVAYIDYNDLVTVTDDGSYTGYGADYLARIAEYTGWNYEYIDMAWPAAYDAVRSGSIDLYMVARQTEERQSEFDFSLYPICNEEMNLYTLPENDIYYEDYERFDGLRIGMLEQSGEIDCFREYANEHGFDWTLVEYPMNEDAVSALQKGDVDAIALVNYSVGNDLKLISNFGVSPAYIMSCDGSEYMAEFSSAQEKLFFDDPSFEQTLEDKYYGESQQYTELLLTRSEAEFIQNAGVLTAALSIDMAPIEYFDERSGSFKGLTVDIYNRISEMTGLKFNFVRRGNAEELTRGMVSGEIQLTGSLAQNKSVEDALHLTQTSKFTNSAFMTVTKDLSSLTSGSVAAIPDGYPQFTDTAEKHGFANTKAYGTFEQCVNAVERGSADFTYIISMCEGYLLDHARYADLYSMTVPDSEYGVCVGVYADLDGRLISIINKCLSVMTTNEINDMIITNTASARSALTFGDFVAKNGFIIIVCAVVILALGAFAIVFAQRNRQRNIMNQSLQKHHDFLQHLYDTLPCGVIRYEYDPPHRILSFNAACAKLYGYDPEDFDIVGSAPDTVVEKGTEGPFQKKFDLCEETGPVMYVWPVTRKDGSTAYTESIMDLVEGDDGRVFQEVIVDVTARTLREKEIEHRYNMEMTRKGKRDKGLLYTACFDVDEQLLTETDIDVAGIHAGMTVGEFVQGLQFELKELQSAEAMEDFATRFTFERLRGDYENGHYDQSFDLCRKKDGQIQWLRSDLTLRADPSTGHLMCFDYIWDVTDDRVTRDIVQRMAFTDCESFISIFAPTSKALQYTVESDGTLSRTEAVYGENDLIYSLRSMMSDEDAKAFGEATKLSFVEKELSKNLHYQLYATMIDEKHERRDKEIIFFYTDTRSSVLAATISDVTKIRADEVLHARLLSDALDAAEKADSAKNQFLSRVSHEMRTPLNAIIGFLELARDADPEKVANCLESSDIAAKQLLSVINDVLDMSSIESGKLRISNVSFNFRHLISSITNVYGAQCRQKGVAFEVKIASPIDDWLVGDELRLNQILTNIIGNSVKFTDSGSITMTISETEVDEKKTFVRFAISDTGCGMSPEMKERLFRPFEQENAVTARRYGGSGLGLSITKNLVTLMCGSISVESEQYVGTTFTVDLPFEKSNVEQSAQIPGDAKSLHILAVDDEESEREYISLVLHRMGVRFKCVSNGEDALKELETAEGEGDAYNVCLVDWKMPGMDGFDATSNIRKKYGKDVVVIVVSAYDFQQAGDEARKAGADLFLSKPIFQSSLFDLLMTLTGGKIAKPKSEPESWDLSGRRVLVAEDNKLNQIVSRGYLAKFNIAMDLAENGEIAVRMFEESEPGFYDAILMDIQMPVMDGLEATRAIRSSSHPDAKTIQIIAQTADAFNEDIARTLSAGMNAHVSKPIKPDVLAKALYKAFTAKKTE